MRLAFAVPQKENLIRQLVNGVHEFCGRARCTYSGRLWRVRTVTVHLGVEATLIDLICYTRATYPHERDAMVRQQIFDEINQRLKALFEQSPAKDLEKNLRAMLQDLFSRLDLVTREDFDVQSEVLKRTREKLDQLESRIAQLEANSAKEPSVQTPPIQPGDA